MGPVVAGGPRQTSQPNHHNEIKGLEGSRGMLATFATVACALFFNWLASAELGIARFSRRSGNPPKTPPKWGLAGGGTRRGRARAFGRLTFY
jgi:hypothetical protein